MDWNSPRRETFQSINSSRPSQSVGAKYVTANVDGQARVCWRKPKSDAWVFRHGETEDQSMRFVGSMSGEKGARHGWKPSAKLGELLRLPGTRPVVSIML